jgi:glycosyltransferase involved in cell wall biosynthesis
MPGRLTNWKGQRLFIEAIQLLSLKDDLKTFIAIILGDEQGRNIYKKQLVGLVEKYRLSKIIKFINNCNEMPIAYKVANLVVSASIEPEAFGRISVEAQSMCLPIIASNIGGSKETIINEKTGLLFDSGKVEMLTDALYKFVNMDDKILHSTGLQGRKNILKKFDVEKMCNSTFTEYKKLLQ